ncbi:hypothetical protein [Sphaerotilus mobilis]|uniref:Uncharacterized protein n=1 Tax=Sphaerotilus mobilis TaxID=47994 RepID=A0A4Q7LLW9_9BURK|nr:hypothetical protein [Sphaerotilus mobilis]RZS54648.1 hypothetical protein EV685_2130 [Sphaerotilus mobilis]
MTVTTMTFQHVNAFDALMAQAGAAVGNALRSVANLFATDAATEPRTAQELLDWADQYEDTQPSYAADLRAAAQRHIDRNR